MQPNGSTAMIAMRHQYLWSKQVSEAWLRANEAKLLAHFAERVAIIERPGRKRRVIEICCARCWEAEELVERVGGRIEKISKLRSVTRSNPLKIGGRLFVTDKQCGSDPFQLRPLFIPAEAAFGTGDHATTAMSLRFMEQITRRWLPGWNLLDAGTGTGILAMAARVFGARNVIALDNDPIAIATAKRNAIRNRIRGIRFRLGDATRVRSQIKFHIIAANLYSELVIAALSGFEKSLRPGGLLILSGILREQEQSIMRALKKTKMIALETRRRGKWIALLAGKRQLPECPGSTAGRAVPF
jgi:ribosomal protein L11 methyltransferase